VLRNRRNPLVAANQPHRGGGARGDASHRSQADSSRSDRSGASARGGASASQGSAAGAGGGHFSGRQSSRASSAAASECGNSLIPGGEDASSQPPNGQDERPILDGPDAGCVLVEGAPPLKVRGLIPFTTYGVQIAAESLAGCSMPTLETFFCTKAEVSTTPSCTFQACRLSFSCPFSYQASSFCPRFPLDSLFTMIFAHTAALLNSVLIALIICFVLSPILTYRWA